MRVTMANPINTELDLNAEVEKYSGEGGSQGDPDKEPVIDPDAKEPVNEENDDDTDDTAKEPDENGDDDAEEADDEDDSAEKPKKTAKSRINELTAARREAERQAEYWRNKAQEAQRAAQPVGTQENEPDAATYDYGEADPKYIRDLTRFEAKKALDEERVNRAQADHNQALQGAMEATISRGRLNYADFDAKVIEGANSGSWDCSQDLALQIIDSEKGDDIAYYLASNPAEARRLSALPFRSLAREIGKLELTLEDAPVVKPKVVSDVPPPPKRTAKGGGKIGGFDPETASFADFEKWAAGQMNRRR